MAVNLLLQRALRLYQQGRFHDAQTAYHAILTDYPNSADAWNLLGVVETQLGKPIRACESIKRAVQLDPENAEFHSNLGIASRRAGRVLQAIDSYKVAVELSGDNARFHFNLGKSYKLIQRYELALSCFQQAVSLDPRFKAGRISLVTTFEQLGFLEEALSATDEALSLWPDDVKLRLKCAALRQKLGRLDQAIDGYLAALKTNPENAQAILRLAGLMIQTGNIAGAQKILSSYDHVPAIQDSHRYPFLCGIVMRVQGDYLKALNAFESALKLDPHFLDAMVQAGLTQINLGQNSQAIKTLKRVLSIQADHVDAYNCLGAALLGLGRLTEAENAYRTINELSNGDSGAATSNCLVIQHYKPGISRQELFASHAQWNADFASEYQANWRVHKNTKIPDRTLNVGFVSSDLGSHPVGYFVSKLFEHIDVEKMRTFAYSDRYRRDFLNRRIADLAWSWNEIIGESNEIVADRIRRDQIDILFDLDGHFGERRMPLFGMRSAPVQISWAGYVGTTGLQAMDYVLADPWHVPRDHEEQYHEKILRMPEAYVCYDPPQYAAEVSRLPMQENGFVRFGSFCNPCKVNVDVLETWSQILRSLPGSTLTLCYRGWQDEGNRARVASVLAENGVDESRLQTSGALPHADLLQLYQQIDIALDTFPYSGGLTTCEALWMGVPVITLPGNTFAGRHSLCYLSNLGMTDWIASNRDEYIRLALNHTQQPAEMSAIRKTLRQKMLASPICDYGRFAFDFQHVVRDAWFAWCNESNEN